MDIQRICSWAPIRWTYSATQVVPAIIFCARVCGYRAKVQRIRASLFCHTPRPFKWPGKVGSALLMTRTISINSACNTGHHMPSSSSISPPHPLAPSHPFDRYAHFLDTPLTLPHILHHPLTHLSHPTLSHIHLTPHPLTHPTLHLHPYHLGHHPGYITLGISPPGYLPRRWCHWRLCRRFGNKLTTMCRVMMLLAVLTRTHT